MKYKYILLDADETLLDFSDAEKQAFKESCVELGVSFSDDIYTEYHEINDSYWKKLELGLTTRDKLKIDRFAELFLETGILSPEFAGDFAEKYIINLSHQEQLLPGALEACSALSKKYRLYIITNGTSSVQHGRLDHSPIRGYMDRIYISEEIGASKPSTDFFNYVLSDIGDTDLSSYLVVGDSPTSDIKGAVDFGIDSCLVTNGKEYSNYGQTYTVKDITGLTDILL